MACVTLMPDRLRAGHGLFDATKDVLTLMFEILILRISNSVSDLVVYSIACTTGHRWCTALYVRAECVSVSHLGVRVPDMKPNCLARWLVEYEHEQYLRKMKNKSGKGWRRRWRWRPEIRSNVSSSISVQPFWACSLFPNIFHHTSSANTVTLLPK